MSLVLGCHNVMVKHTAGLLKQLLYFVNVEISFQETQNWRNIKLTEHDWEEEFFKRAFWDERQQLKMGNLRKSLSQSVVEINRF